MDIKKRLEAYRVVTSSGCWLWTGPTDSRGRPIIFYNGKTRIVARLSAHLFLDFDLSSSLQINHKRECNNPPGCWIPAHLYIGTQKENMQDSVALKTHNMARRTHCPKGHPLDGINYNHSSKVKWSKRRCCLQCQREANWKRNGTYEKNIAKAK